MPNYLTTYGRPLFSPASTTLTFDGDPEGDNPTRGYRRKEEKGDDLKLLNNFTPMCTYLII